MKKNTTIILFFLLIANSLFAQLSTVSYTTAGNTYSQTFDGLSSSSNVNLFANGNSDNTNPLGPYDLSASPTSVAGLAGWQVYKIAGTTAANGFLTLGMSSGGSTSGNFYNLGAAASSDRALGLLNASTISTGAIGVILTNNTGSTLTSFSVAFTAEQWRQNTGTNTFTFKYAMGSGSSFNDISTPTFTSASTGNFSNPNTGAAVALVGNATANQVAKSFTISNITWNNGDKLVLRWESATATNNNAIGIDNFSFSANNTSSNTYTWSGAANGNYQTASNWTPNRSSPLTNDILTFPSGSSVISMPTETIAGLTVTGSSGSVTLTPASSGNVLTLGSTLTIPAGTTLDFTTTSLAGGFTTAGTGTLNTAATGSTPLPAGTTFTMDVNYNGTTAQTIVAGNYNNLTISGSRATNNVTLAASGTIAIASTFSNTATFSGGGGYVITGSTINYSGTGAQSVIAFNYNNLTISGARSGNVTLASSGTIGVAGIFSANATFSSGNYVNTGSTIDFNGSGNQTNAIASFTYNNLSITNTGVKSAGSSTITINANGVLTVASGTTFDLLTRQLSGSSFTTSGSGLLRTANTSSNALPVDLTWSMEVEYNSTVANQTVQRGNYNNLTISGSRTSFSVTLASGTTTIAGVFNPSATFSSGGYNFNTSTSTISFSSTNAQTIPAFNYNNLTITGARTSNNVTLASSGTIGVAGTFSTTGLSFSGGSVINAGSTINFNGISAQSVGGSSAFAFNNLTISNTAANVSATGTISLALTGVLNIANGVIFDLGTNVINGANGTNGSFTTIGTGLLKTASLSSNPIPVDLSWTMDVEYYSTSGNQTIQRGVYNNLLITGARTSFNVTFASSTTTIGGTFSPTATFTSGNYLYNNTNSTLSFSGTGTQTIPAFNFNNLTITGARTSNNVTLASSGTIGVAGTFSTTGLSFSGGAVINAGSTINFNGNIAQSVGGSSAFNFNNLTISNTAATVTATGTIGMVSAGILNIANGAIFDLATNVITGAITTTGTGLLKTASLSSNPIPVDLSWTMDVEYYSTSGNQTIQRGLYNNLIISGARTNFNVTFPSLTTTIGGTFSPTASFTTGNYLYNNTNSTISFSSTGAQTIPAFNYNNLTITGARTSNNVTLASLGIIGVAGTFSTAGLSFSGGSVVNAGSTINFNGTTAQSVGGSAAFTFNNLTISNTGASVSATGTIGMASSGVLNIANGAIFDLATNILTGAITTTGTGRIKTASPSSNPIPVDVTWAMDVEFYGTTSNQTIQRGVYNNLIISGARTGFTVTFASATTTIGGTFSPTATFTTGGYLYNNTNSTIAFNSTTAQTIPAFNYNNLTISGTRTSNNITLASSGTIGVAGNFTASATFSSGGFIVTGSTINLNGTIAQNIPVFTFNNLTLTNSAGATLTGNETINETLTLTNGKLTVGNNTLTLGSSATVNASSTNYIVTNGTGALIMNNVSTATFPIGTTTSYLPLSVANATNTPNISVSVKKTITNTPPNSNEVVNAEWSILSSTNSNADVTYQYNTSDQASGYTGINPVLGVYATTYSESALNMVSTSNPFSVKAVGLSLPTITKKLYVIGNNHAFVLVAASAPTNVSATFGDAQATVDFDPPTDNGGAIITGYIVTSNPGGITATATASPITVTGLTNGTAYTFTVVAVNCQGPGTSSAASNSVTPITIPSAPTSVFAVAGNTQATISFTGSANNGGSSITGYTVTSSPSGLTATGSSSPITVTGLTNGTAYTFTVVATNAAGNSVPSDPSDPVTPSATTIWNGITWSNGTPNNGKDGIINGNLTTATVYTFKNLTVNSGFTYISNAAVTVVGSTFVNNGTITGIGTISMAGNTTQTISGTGTVNNISINNNNGATVSSGSNKLNITGILTLQSGLLTTNGNVVLKSNSITSSGILAPVGTSGNNGTVSGNVTVERYIPKGFRGFRDIAPAVANAGSMFNNWQEAGAYTSGTGIFITGEVGASKGFNATTGIDYTKTVDSSTWTSYYNNSAVNNYSTGKLQGTRWFYVLNTKTTTLDPYQPYRVLVRGDRSFDLFSVLPILGTNGNTRMVNGTAIRATGKLITGNVVYSTTGVSNGVYSSSTVKLNGSSTSAFSAIANPYVCPVDLSQVSATGIEGNGTSINKFYYFDPTISSTGNYVVVLNGVKNVPASNATGILQPGQSIFVRNNASTTPTITFTEAAKVTNTTKTAVFGVNSINRMDFTLLRKLPTDNLYSIADGAVAVFNAGYSNGYNSNEDAAKLNNANDNISIVNGNANLSIDGRAIATATDSIALKLGALSTKAYQLQVDGSSFTANGLTAYLYDAYLKTTTALTSGVNKINFTVDNAIAATYTNRFGVMFKPTAPLSVKAIYASATLKNEVATINWNTQGEEKVATYTVEKSTDAKNFNKVGEAVVAKNSTTASYSATDKNIANGNTYYRIKATNLDGSVQYSNIAKLSTYDLELSTYNLYPNPLKGKALTIQINNVAAGKYTVIIYNALGQKVVNQVVAHEGAIANHAMNIGTQLSAGVYTVSILGSEGKVSETKLSVE